MLCSKLHCQEGFHLIIFLYKIRLSVSCFVCQRAQYRGSFARLGFGFRVKSLGFRDSCLGSDEERM